MTYMQRAPQLALQNTQRYKIGFLFNHEAAHQVAHSAPIASQLALTDSTADIVVLATSPSLLERARNFCDVRAQALIRFELLETPSWQLKTARIMDSVWPFSRIANLVRHKNRLAQFDVLVVPERTSLLLKSLLGLKAPLLVHTKHGSGDRAQGYSKRLGKFDLVLLSGEKLRDRMVDAKAIKPERSVIVGYPKFDTIAPSTPESFFDNGKPTVVYNPHVQPGLSSWFDVGLDILNYFANQPDFNLIFAPHVMLFQRRLHVSLEDFKIKLRRNLPSKFLSCPHILIDTNSPKLLDMTYMRSADIYLGDVSSQIYEFLLNPRPMIFLNPRSKPWKGDPNYENWNFGAVVSDMNDLEGALKDALANPDRYRLVQERGFRYTFDLNEKPSSMRAANAITQFTQQRLSAQALFPRQGHAVDAHSGGVHAVQQF